MPPTKTTPTPIHQLTINPIFNTLSPREQLYAHHLARSMAWHGSRIIMRQVSPESPDIVDFIMDLYHACDGNWDTLTIQCNVTSQEVVCFLEYAAAFLCNLGNYYGEGDQKFVPELSVEALERIASISSKTRDGLKRIIGPLLAVPRYYPSSEPISQEEIDMVSEVMRKHSIGPENTRIQKLVDAGKPVYQVLQASVETGLRELADGVFLIRGDHSEELSKVCTVLAKAKEYAVNKKQSQVLDCYVECFRTGSLEAFQESKKIWVTDKSARVEHLIGFVEAYRDPAGIRAEWEAMVGIADPNETARLKLFVEHSTAFIRQLPWAVEGVNDGKGPFEKDLFEAPDSQVFMVNSHLSPSHGAQLTSQYESIREACGFKNIVLANRLSANNNTSQPPWIDLSQLNHFKRTSHIVRFLTTAIHELLGHGTGKLLSETEPGVYNFDKQNPPISPLTGKAITSHYRPGQTWTSVFGKLAGTVEEYRAILISEYLMDNKELLG
ncbi:hypothetical protein P170DRAFT_443778 [Aspergillus steynii IBT 23096]|uniref:Dipeptidyl peptidase III n=1 Tax=Aspergillus steynii IBT 23096 TaxID=1392250 RepID=A0A2I2GFJ0_9EURO|nr:uncharacterized protein P170DRAFT_443778 [Aspergillus steynii IBT 23096]PLB51597.1 hypothetical protein P170DRAFT_443778 [Aspergillus steynii IBT 23096]